MTVLSLLARDVMEGLFLPDHRSPSTPTATPSVGSGSSFDDVYASYFQQVRKWVRSLGGPDSELDDLTQETFLVVRDKLDAFDGRNPSAWLYRIARNVVSDHRRRAWFRRAVPRSGDDFDRLPSGQEGAEAGLQRREAQLVVERLLSRLSTDHRSAFVLFEVEGYSGEEIAEIQQVPVNTVYTRLHHARRRFLRLVQQEMRRQGEGKP